MSVHIFVGPSLPIPVEEAQRLCPGHYHPPVRMGDVYTLLAERPRVIGIVDGLFHGTPAVWHKELLAAMSQGVTVVGAASMGALRAAELATLGMVGVGRVFEQLRDGALEDDDAVAVLHAGPEDLYRPLSEALVNLEHGLALAAQSGALGEATRGRLVELARGTHYTRRSWPALLGACSPDEAVGLAAFLERERPNLKRDDALAMLEWVRALDPAQAAPRPEFAPTLTFGVAMERVAQRRRAEAAQPIAAASSASSASSAIATDASGASREPLLHDWLVIAEAQRLGVALTQAEFSAEYAAFLAENGVTGSAEAWAHGRGVSEGVVQHHVAIRGLRRRLLLRYGPQLASLEALSVLRRTL